MVKSFFLPRSPSRTRKHSPQSKKRRTKGYRILELGHAGHAQKCVERVRWIGAQIRGTAIMYVPKWFLNALISLRSVDQTSDGRSLPWFVSRCGTERLRRGSHVYFGHRQLCHVGDKKPVSVNLVCSKTQILLEIWQTQCQHLVECTAYLLITLWANLMGMWETDGSVAQQHRSWGNIIGHRFETGRIACVYIVRYCDWCLWTSCQSSKALICAPIEIPNLLNDTRNHSSRSTHRLRVQKSRSLLMHAR